MANQNIINIDKEIRSRVSSKIPNEMENLKLQGFKILNTEFLKADFKIKDEDAVFLPEQKHYDIYKNCNNSDERRGWTENIALTKNVTLNRSITFSKVIQSGSSMSVNVSFPKVGASGSRSKNITITNQRNWSETEQVTSNTTRNINFTVEPKKILFVKLEKTVYSVRVPFDCVLLVDAIVEVEYLGYREHIIIRPGNPPKPRLTRIPRRKTKRYQLSDLLKEEQRVFETDGFIENRSADMLEVSYFERDYNPSTDNCDDGLKIDKEVENLKSVEDVDYVENEIDLITDDRTLNNVELIEPSEYPDVEKFNLTIEEYFGTISIKTSNSYANVYIRHLSFGPGFCEVETRSSLGNSIVTMGPPAIWSEWQVIEAHAGQITMTVNDIVKCDTGVRSQIKYWKE